MCVHMCGSSLVQWLRSKALNPRIEGSIHTYLGLTVVTTVSKSLNSHLHCISKKSIGTKLRGVTKMHGVPTIICSAMTSIGHGLGCTQGNNPSMH